MVETQRLGIIDMETGEILEDRAIFISSRKDRKYLKVFVAFLDDILETDDLAGKSIKLLFYLLKSLSYDDLTLTVIPKRAIEDLKITRNTYNRWINDLIRFNIIEKVDNYTYKLRPYTFVKGSSRKAISKEEQG